jgi:hypothetical protein
MPTDRESDIGIMERVERSEIALARYAEHVAHPVDHQLVYQDLATGPTAVIRAHNLTIHYFWIATAEVPPTQ